MTTALTDVYKRLDEVSTIISTQVRTLTAGLLALTWLFLASGGDAPELPIVEDKRQLLLIAALCIASLLLDLLQYQFRYQTAFRAKEVAERARSSTATYKKDWLYKAGDICFWGKQLVSAAAAVWLLVLLGKALA